MFPKKFRLSSHEVLSVCSRGKRISTDNLVLYAVSRGDDKPSKFAVSVAKSAQRNASGRNRLKRLIRESVRNLADGVCPGFDAVIVVTKPLHADTFTPYRDSVRSLFEMADILCGRQPKP